MPLRNDDLRTTPGLEAPDVDDPPCGPAVRAWRKRRNWFESTAEIRAAEWLPGVETAWDYQGLVATTCLHCSMPKRHHVRYTKCLFDHTTYEPFGKERTAAAWKAVAVEEEWD